MKHLFLTILAGLALTAAVNAQQTFKVKIDQPAHGLVRAAFKSYPIDRDLQIFCIFVEND